jgi:hypothetical protein
MPEDGSPFSSAICTFARLLDRAADNEELAAKFDDDETACWRFKGDAGRIPVRDRQTLGIDAAD